MSGKRILIAMANDGDARLMAKPLISHGYNARPHRGPWGTLSIASHWEPSIIIIDCFMMGLSGPDMIGLLAREVPAARCILTATHSERRLAAIAVKGGFETIAFAAFREPLIPRVVEVLETSPRSRRAPIV